MKKISLLVFGIAVLFLISATYSFSQMESTSFKIPVSSLNGGGSVPMQTEDGTGSFIMGTSLGQSTPIGESKDPADAVFLNGAGLWYQLAALRHDTDGDSIPDFSDNCTLVDNPDQRDTNSDGFGNLCDPDTDNDGIVGLTDFNDFRDSWLKPFGDPAYNADADYDGGDIVGLSDFNIFRDYWLGVPGPSCCGTLP